MNEQAPQQWNKFYLKDVSFKNLMTHRIFNVLIIANPYDAFMLEDDGRVDEKIFNEYTELGLRYPPTFTQVSTMVEASEVLSTTSIDLVICMPGNADNDAFTVARAVKREFPDIPCVVLTPFSHGITQRIMNEDLSIFEYVFCWLGNTNLILSIIKLIEDKMNLEHDIDEAGVQMILLVEDSIRFYSSILPNLYSYILTQSQSFATEALNSHTATLRMRGRPKVVLARTYEEAMDYFVRFPENILGVISDCRFPKGGVKDSEAGLKLLSEFHRRAPFLPLIMESSETENAEKAEKLGFRFIDKNSKKMNIDLRNIMAEHMGFGDFIFRDPKTHEEIRRIRNLKELQDNIFSIPNDSMLYHLSRNHVSRWLCARAIFPVSEFHKTVTLEKLRDVDLHRQIIFDAIVQYRHMKNVGTVAVFKRDRFDAYSHFARIGDGSLGGKGRGLAFLDNIIKTHPEFNEFEGVNANQLESHLLSGGRVDNVVDALIAAHRANLDLSFERAAAIDLAGRNVFEAVKMSVTPKIIETPWIAAVAIDGIEVKVIAKVTVRANLSRLVGGAGEETIIARVGEGIVTTVGSSQSHKSVLENPDLISRTVLSKGLDSGTAFEILSIDIADVDIGRNIGAHLQIQQAEADKQIAQAKAEERRATAIAKEQEMKAEVEHMKAKVVEAEAEVPRAMAEALRSGNLGVMDYYKMQNVLADTAMKNNVGNTDLTKVFQEKEGKPEI